MSPLAVITAIVMGSAVTITLGLAMVTAVFLILGSDYPRQVLELPHLLKSLGLFLTLATAGATAFWAVMYRRPWLWAAQAAMWLTVLGLGFYYWPK